MTQYLKSSHFNSIENHRLKRYTCAALAISNIKSSHYGFIYRKTHPIELKTENDKGLFMLQNTSPLCQNFAFTSGGLSPSSSLQKLPQLKPPTPLPLLKAANSLDSANDNTYLQSVENTKEVMTPRVDNIVLAISSGALFDFAKDHEIQQTQGEEAYSQYQIENESNILEKGVGFSLVEKLFNINEKLAKVNSNLKFDVVIASKNTPDACVRAMNSARHYGLPIIRSAFTGGELPFVYAKAFGATLYLTTNPTDAKKSVEAGIPAAQLIPSKVNSQEPDLLRIAFDADAVIFSDDSERISKNHGLNAFYDHERNNAQLPLLQGPLYPLLRQLSLVKKAFPKNEQPIRIAVTTARAAPAHERLVKTLRSWGIAIDELHLLGGKNKGPFLDAFKADLFLDDKLSNVEDGAENVVSGHVHFGVNNEPQHQG